jgi:hypothetical protein
MAVVLLGLTPSMAISQQFLEPEDGLFTRKRELAYYDQLYDALIKSNTTFAVARTVCIPSFSAEWTVTVEGRVDSTFVVIATTPQAQLGAGLLLDPKVKLARLKKTKVLVFQRDISSEDAKAIQDIFLSMTSEARYADSNWIVFDGETYHFSLSKAGVGLRCGRITSPKDGTPPGRLVSLSKTLFDYAKAGNVDKNAVLEQLRTQVQQFFR